MPTWSSRCAFPTWSRRPWKSFPIPAATGWWWRGMRRDTCSEHVHLHCKDDGVGIAAANLERVFDKDFSTKSRETNYGIGLHWCANAIGALGGRIWAASEGPGLGASMHLMLPLPARDSRSIA